jgi:hypothetical protein
MSNPLHFKICTNDSLNVKNNNQITQMQMKKIILNVINGCYVLNTIRNLVLCTTSFWLMQLFVSFVSKKLVAKTSYQRQDFF